MIEVTHNFDPACFMWLWAKYVNGFSEKNHCTNAIRGHYSKKFSKNNPAFPETSELLFDERAPGSYDAIYICGVAKNGYTRKQNYQHNVHAAVLPVLDGHDEWSFEGWRMTVHGGRFLTIPAAPTGIPERYRTLDDAYTTCRIFRWAAAWYSLDRERA
jgi:hypothetical protein